ncbi:hypothetical protein HY988_01955 [Candidatus Micrarchaeota archaeon]|nr:hypothetical protein [Candidatus Micrarchaeota archaeon]
MADRLLVRKNPTLEQASFTEELLAHPEKDGKFKFGCDLIDRINRWTIPWSDVLGLCPASEFAELSKMALLITLFNSRYNFTESDRSGRLIIIPEKILPIPHFLQETG